MNAPNAKERLPATANEQRGTMNKTYASVNILGVRVHNITLHDTLSYLKEMALSDTSNHIVTTNPEFIMLAQHNQEFRTVLNHAALSLPDGIGVVWAARWLGEPIRERVTGIDMVKQLATAARESGLSMFLLGAAPGIAERAAEQIGRAHV